MANQYSVSFLVSSGVEAVGMRRSLGLLCGGVCFLGVISRGGAKSEEAAILRSGSEEGAKFRCCGPAFFGSILPVGKWGEKGEYFPV
jgi:hypothetical protein